MQSTVGADGLTVEHIKAFINIVGEFAVDLLVGFFNRIVELHACPTNRTTSVLIPIPKPGVTNTGLTSDVSNWCRVMTVTCIVKNAHANFKKKDRSVCNSLFMPCASWILKRKIRYGANRSCSRCVGQKIVQEQGC